MIAARHGGSCRRRPTRAQRPDSPSLRRWRHRPAGGRPRPRARHEPSARNSPHHVPSAPPSVGRRRRAVVRAVRPGPPTRPTARCGTRRRPACTEHLRSTAPGLDRARGRRPARAWSRPHRTDLPTMREPRAHRPCPAGLRTRSVDSPTGAPRARHGRDRRAAPSPTPASSWRRRRRRRCRGNVPTPAATT